MEWCNKLLPREEKSSSFQHQQPVLSLQTACDNEADTVWEIECDSEWMWLKFGVQWEVEFDHGSHVPKDRRKEINFMGMLPPSSAISTSLLPSNQIRAQWPPLQNMVISPLRMRGKKEGVKPEASFSIHAVINHKKRLAPKKTGGWKAEGLPYWAARASLGRLDAANQNLAA